MGWCQRPRAGRLTAVSDFRFSFNIFGVQSHDAFVAKCRRAESYGYDTVFACDHLGTPAPFPLLVVAAQATEQLRVGTLVLNVPFWNPALLAREVATTDILTGGRLEIGLGAGHMKWEFDAAGIVWEPLATRADRLSIMIKELGRFFTTDLERIAEGVRAPQPVQRRGFGGSGPPLIVGGTGDRILRLAAEHADIVSIAGAYQVKGEPPGTFRLGTAAEALERVRFAREHARERADQIEWHLLIQRMMETDDRRAAANDLIERLRGEMTVEDALETPFLLIGTAEEMAEQLVHARERYGFSYITVHEPYMEAFAPVIERLNSRPSTERNSQLAIDP
jgi:probable F420-dependent oxidoreductase